MNGNIQQVNAAQNSPSGASESRRHSSVSVPPELHDELAALKRDYGVQLNRLVAWSIRQGLPAVRAELRKLDIGRD